MWNLLGNLRTWEIAAAVVWTLYCSGSWLAARRARRQRGGASGWISYSTVWLAGFAATFALLQIVVHIPPTASGTDSMVKTAPRDEPTKLSNMASARD